MTRDLTNKDGNLNEKRDGLPRWDRGQRVVQG